METTTEKPQINNTISYNRITELESLLKQVQNKMDAMYSDDFYNYEELEKEIKNAIDNIWKLRRDHDVKKLMEFKK